jgi:tRNA nucleotidyltransferase/poly(A) polymerase
MLQGVRSVLAGEEAWVVGGAVRDEALGRPLLDVDVACREPRRAAEAFRRLEGGAVFPLSERHGAWRVARPDGGTVDFTPLRDGIEADLATRDFTINAVAVPLSGGDWVDPFEGGRDLESRLLRGVSERIFEDDPLRLLRAVRLEEELGFRLEAETERLVRAHAGLVTRPAGERILAELERLSPAGFERLDELGLLAPLGGSLERARRVPANAGPGVLLVAVLGEALERLPIANDLRRLGRTVRAARLPPDASPREVHRFRRKTEPWAREAASLLGAGSELLEAIAAARERDPDEPLLRGDELGLPPGPEVGRLLERIEEERAAGTISTREEALALVGREARR